VDVNPGAASSDPRELVAAGGGVYFRAVTEGVGFAGDLELVWMQADGSFDVIDLNTDDSGFESSAPRQIIAVDSDTVAVFGDDDGQLMLWLVTGTTVDLALNLTASHSITGVPFLEGGSELFQGDVMFFAEQGFGNTQLFRFDTATNSLTQVTYGSPSAQSPFEYSMATSVDPIRGELLWFVYDQGYGDGLELHVYGDPYGFGYDYFQTWTSLDPNYSGYDPNELQVIAV
jgi:hypothetical protein